MIHIERARRSIAIAPTQPTRQVVQDAASCVERQKKFFNDYLGLDCGDVEVNQPTITLPNKVLKPLLVPAGILASEALMCLEALKVDVHCHIQNPDMIFQTRNNHKSYVVWTPTDFNPDERYLGKKPGYVGGNVTKPQTFLEHILMQIRDTSIQLSRENKKPRLHNESCATICDA